MLDSVSPGQKRPGSRPAPRKGGNATVDGDSVPAERHIGLDEAGRGCLAGPVVAAAVLFPAEESFAETLAGLADSKVLSEKQRERLAACIRESAVAVGVGVAWQQEIDEVNILAASLRAMARAVAELAFRLPDGLALPLLALDGNQLISEAHWEAANGWPVPEWARAFSLPGPVARNGHPLPRQTAIVGGDAKVPAISAASIIAKTVRDELMARCDELFPGYGFARHKGYGTREHMAVIRERGPCPLHRLTFRGVRPEPAQLTLL